VTAEAAPEPAREPAREPAAAGHADDYRLDDQAGYLLGAAFAKAHGNLRRRIAEFDVTPPQHAVIMRLHQHGEVSQNSLGRMAGMKPATIHGIVRRLKARGVAASRPDPNDGRLHVVTLSPAGRALAHELASRSLDATAATVAPLSAAERTSLMAMLRRML
jgi:DNA-binding MarR family transcriptional regulator